METRNVVYPISVVMLVQVGNILAVPVPQGIIHVPALCDKVHSQAPFS